MSMQKICRKTLVVLILGAVSASAQNLSFNKSLESGLDNAVLSSFSEACDGGAIGDMSSVDVDTAFSAAQSMDIVDGNLQIVFDSEKVKAALASKGVVLWSGLADPVLVWMVDKDANAIIGGDFDADVSDSLHSSAVKQRYQLLFPLMDLDDVHAVNVTSIESGDTKTLIKASARYGAAFFVVGELAKNGGNFSADWKVYDRDGKVLSDGVSEENADAFSQKFSSDIAKVLANNVQDDQAPQAVAEDYSSLGPGQGFVRVQITGIDNIADYKNIQNALVTYGYGADSSVVAWDPNGAVIQIPTSSNASILDGTLSHASEFSKIGAWIYRYNNSKGEVAPSRSGIGRADPSRTVSTIKLDSAQGAKQVPDNIEQLNNSQKESTLRSSQNETGVVLTDDMESSSVALEGRH